MQSAGRLWFWKVSKHSMKWFSKMFQGFLNETRRLAIVIGLTFGVILVFQYLELPYSNVLSSLLSAGKVQIQLPGNSRLQNGDLQVRFEIADDRSFPNVSNYNGTYAVHDISNNTTRTTSSYVLDGNEGSNKSAKNLDGFVVQKEAKPPEQNFSGNISSIYDQESSNGTSDHVGNAVIEFGSIVSAIPPIDPLGFVTPSPSLPSIDLSPQTAPAIDTNEVSTISDDSTAEEHEQRPDQSQSDIERKGTASPISVLFEKNKQPEIQTLAVYTISDMNHLLGESRASYNSVIPQWSSPIDHELQLVKFQIENAPIVENDSDLYAPLYHNVSVFKRSYELMEETLKVYVYREGKRPILHTPILKGIYASEGWFMKLLETNKKFVTKNPRKAHLFYLPFSSRMLEETLYVPNSHNYNNLIQYLKNYVDTVAGKYSFWNRTEGADHFLVACHDWAPAETRKYMSKCIRALCNSDLKEGFVFGKDVSLPETFVRLQKNPLRDVGGKPPTKRSILAFFAGSMHGYLRPILLKHWENKDPDMKIFGKLPKKKGNVNYVNYMKSSKYCICAKGYEVNSPRVVEAIFYECVPVIISDNFVPPFFEVLNWELFAVFVMEKDIPNLKNILLSIPEKRFRKMQLRVKRVQKHFLWHPMPVKYDIFHMILHSIWYNRLYQIRPI